MEDNIEKEDNPIQNVPISNIQPNQQEIKSIVKESLQRFRLINQFEDQSNINFNKFDKEQTDQLLRVIEKNEDHAFSFHQEKIKSDKEIALAQIGSSSINNRTLRITIICTLIAFVIITLAILFYKDQYLTNWLYFIAGLFGGAGLNSMFRSFFKKEKINLQINKEDFEDKED